MIDASTTEAIARPLVRTRTLLSTHRLFVGDLTSPVTVQLWRDWQTTRLSAEVSHESIFLLATMAGYIPAESWLEPVTK